MLNEEVCSVTTSVMESCSAALSSDDFSGLPIDALLMHKNWKARKEAFERIRDNPLELKEHILKKTKKLSSENNAAVQESFFEALAALVGVCDDSQLDVIVGEPLKMVVEKGITGRPKAVQINFALVSELVGLGKQVAVFDILLHAFAHKTPKNRMAAAQLCSHIIGEYGIQGLPVKLIMKSMHPLFNDANAQVRKEASLLCCQCYRFLGSEIKGFLSNLRDVQLQEFERLFEGITVGEAPLKCIRGNAPFTSMKLVTPMKNLTDHDVPSNDVDDSTYELLDEVQILTKLPRNFYRVALDKSAKWQDRVAMVEDYLLPLIAAPKIRQKDDYHELASMVREFLVDPQAPLMLMGFRCIQELARVLRASFAPYARSYLSPLFEKMKDKKTSVVEHITSTLETLIRYRCISLDHCQDEIELTAQSRVPNQRLALTLWLSRLTEKLDCNQFNRLVRAQNMLGRLMTDEKAEIREASCTLVAKLISLFGEGCLQNLLMSLDERQRAKLVAVVNTTSKINCAPSNSPAKKLQRIEQHESYTAVEIRRSHSNGNRNNAATVNTSTRGKRPASVIPHTSLNGARKYNTSDDAVALESTLPSRSEVLKHMLSLMDNDTTVLPLLRSREWSHRYNGILKVRAMVSSWSVEACTENLDTVLVFLRADPGWRESIHQVFQAMISLIQELVTRATDVSPGASYAIVAGCTSRLGEVKNKAIIRELMLCIAKSQGIGFVLKHLIGTLLPVKTPKLTQECNECMTQLLYAFPSHTFDPKAVVEYVKMHSFDQLSPAVRSSGIMLLVALRYHMGPDMENYLKDISPALRNAYDDCVAQANVTKSTCSTSTCETRRETPFVSSSRAHIGSPRRGTSQSGMGESPSTNMSPAATPCSTDMYTGRSCMTGNLSRVLYENNENQGRADIGQQLLQLARQITSETDWRLRLEAVKKVEELLYANNKCIAPNGVTEVLRAFCTRLEEVNKNFVFDVLRIVCLVVESAGAAACRTGLKKILQGVLGMLGDKKTNLREGAASVAYLALDCLGLDTVLQHIHKPLTVESHTSNQMALDLIEKGFQREPGVAISRQVVISLVPAVVRLCMSRILEVRSSAERVIGHFLPIAGDETVLRAVQSLRPAEQQSVMMAIERQFQLFLRTSNGGNEEEMEVQHVTPLPTSTVSHSPSTSNLVSSQTLHHTNVGSVVFPRSAENSVKTHPTVQVPSSPTEEEVIFKDPPSAVFSSLSPSRSVPVRSRNDELLSIQEIMVGLRSASSTTASSTCVEFLKRLQNGEDCGTPEMIQVMVERLCENIKQLDVDLALGLIQCLKTIFERPNSSRRCHSSLLFRMLGMIFDCLLSESFSLQEKVIKALNNMTLKLLEGCPGNDVFSALMSRMTRYSGIYIKSGKKIDLKYIQVTVKCLMRLEINSISEDNVILCCHEYLLQHPPSAFRNLDDISVRTVKTILQDLSRRCGPPLLLAADRLVGSQNLVTHFIRACLENQERLGQANENHSREGAGANGSSGGNQEKHEQSSLISSQQNSLRYASNVHCDPNDTLQLSAKSFGSQSKNSVIWEERSISSIFSRIRNHTTSNQGIEELYAYIKQHPKSPCFEQQFQRCSEAFRSFIKRKVERQMREDPEKLPDFTLPDILRLTP